LLQYRKYKTVVSCIAIFDLYQQLIRMTFCSPPTTYTYGLYRDILPLFTPAGASKRLLQRRQKAWCFSADDKILRSSSVAAARKVLVSHDGQVTAKKKATLIVFQTNHLMVVASACFSL